MMLMSLPRMVPVVLRHALDYVDLAAVDTREAAHAATRRFIAIVVAAVAGSLALLMSCVMVIALTWDGPYRVLAVSLLLAAFVIAAGVSYGIASRGVPGKMFTNVRTAWSKDQEALRDALRKDEDEQQHRTTEEMIHGVDPQRSIRSTR